MAFSIQDYEMLGPIGSGGFGTILKARQKSLGRIVAIKSLAPQRALSQKDIVRFRREAQAMAMLAHDNIVSVLDYACIGNNYYIVMEFIDGITFETALESGISQPGALLVMEKVVSGLKFAHSQQIIHRDIKPGNILLGKQGQVKLADFGLAAVHPDVSQYSSSAAVLGTFSYMAPEAMVTPKEVDVRIDIFSLGCIFYQILQGRTPFSGSTIGEVSYKILNENPAPPSAAEPLSPICSVTMRCLEKERERRPDIDEIHKTILAVLSSQYHAIQEELIRFIEHKPTESGESTVIKNGAKLSSKKPLPITMSIVAAFCIVIIVTLIAWHLRRNGLLQTGTATNLPRLEFLTEQRPTVHVQQKRQPGDSQNLTNGPMTDMTAGFLVVKSLSRGDTVTINNQRIEGDHSNGQWKYSLESGHYTVSVVRKGRQIIQRNVRVMPYQVFILDLEQERKRHGRASQ